MLLPTPQEQGFSLHHSALAQDPASPGTAKPFFFFFLVRAAL